MKIHHNNITTLQHIYLAAEAGDLRYYICTDVMHTNSQKLHSA